jgi:hypothetical protein
MKALKSNPSKTVLVICTGMVLLHFILELEWTLYLSLGMGLVSILSEWISKKIEWLWFKLTYLLSLIVPNILLGLIFYLLLTPIAFFANLFKNKDSLQLKKPTNTTYKTINKTYLSKDLVNPW